MRLRLALAGLAVATLAVSAQQGGEEQLPRFRAGANLVRVDAYFTKDGVGGHGSQAGRTRSLRRRQAAED